VQRLELQSGMGRIDLEAAVRFPGALLNFLGQLGEIAAKGFVQSRDHN
jgi:hypothetical protein